MRKHCHEKDCAFCNNAAPWLDEFIDEIDTDDEFFDLIDNSFSVSSQIALSKEANMYVDFWGDE